MRRTDDRPAVGAAAAATDGAAVVEAALGLLEEGLGQLAGVDASSLPEDCVTATVRQLARLDGRVDGIQARFVAAAERAGVPERSGATSTADWLSDTTGRSKRQSARTDRMARTAEEAPELVDRLASGDIGPDQAESVARGLDRGTLEPEDAADLVRHAKHLPPGAFDRERKRLEGRRHQQRLREQEDAAHRARSGSVWREDDGSLGLKFQLAPADGDLVDKTISAFVSPDAAEVPDHLRRTPRQLKADALVDICRVALAAGPVGDVAGEPTRVNVHVGPAMLLPQQDAQEAGATGVTDLDTVLSPAAVKRLMCDSTVQRLVIDPEGQVLGVGRATRKWPNATRTAIVALDGRDRTPGSDLPPGRCEIHHVRFWSEGGETSVENGVLLGPRGHDMVHKEGWSLVMDPVTRICTWTSPDGETTITTHPRGTAARGPGAPHDIPELRERRDPATAAEQAATEQAAAVSRGRGTNDPTPPGRPPGRGDPGRPRGPSARRATDPHRGPPGRGRPAPLQLDL